VSESTIPDTGTTGRHSWNHRDKHNKTCTRCGTWAQKRPSPHGRRWFTEWRLPDGTYVNNYAGGKTPPCIPAPATTGED
jgi:hypothetical protein